MENIEKIDFTQISFAIISYAGSAKSDAICSIGEAKAGNFEAAEKLLVSADKNIIDAERQHMEVIQQEAQGVKHQIPVLFMHAEDQMMTAQMMIEVAKEFLDLYKALRSK